MTSRELISGFDFSSCGHLRLAVMHLQYNLMQDGFIQSTVLTFFRNLRSRPPPSWIFSLCEFGHSGELIVWYLCYIPNLVQISKSLRSTHICFRLSFDDVTRINLWFWILVTWSSPRRRGASSHVIWCKITLSSPKLLTFFRNSRWRLLPSWIFSLCEFGHSSVFW